MFSRLRSAHSRFPARWGSASGARTRRGGAPGAKACGVVISWPWRQLHEAVPALEVALIVEGLVQVGEHLSSRGRSEVEVDEQGVQWEPH